ncbi:hypothetical protein TWF730_006908 [Orbilia blumenaviensis]|uniref:Uncharacterized protein n=1 Tax=Orbilia blumenaviensis TaxID=1796055 RepID=A0AAV9VIL4_9PEZI
MFKPRQLTEIDIRFKKLLDASPMPKCVQRIYDSLGRHHRQGHQRSLEQQQPTGGEPDPGIRRREPSKSDQKDQPVSLEVHTHPHLKAEPSSPPVGDTQQRPKADVSIISNNGVEQNVAINARRKQGSYRKSIPKTRARSEVYPQVLDTRITTSRRRRSARSSGPREYWILGSHRGKPVYNEAALSKPRV